MKKHKLEKLILIVFILLSLSSCDNHQHVFNQFVSYNDYLHTSCCECGEMYSEEHEYELSSTLKDATCQELGVGIYRCIKCGHEITKEIEKKEHVFTNFKSDGNSTCVVRGTMTRRCLNCSYTVTVTDYSTGNGHVYDQCVIDNNYLKAEATCISQAVYYKSCTCGECLKTDSAQTFTYGYYADHKFENNSTTCSTCNKGVEDPTFSLTFLSYFNDNYGYEGLNDTAKEFYNKLDKEMIKFYYGLTEADSANIIHLFSEYTDQTLRLSLADALLIYRQTHPLFYFMDNIVPYVTDEGFAITAFSEYKAYSTRKSINELIFNELYQIKENTKDYNEYNKIKYIHDYIIENTNYAYDINGIPSESSDAHSVVGFFNNSNVVCEGYAKTMDIMLNYIGVDSILVSGDANVNNTSEKHSWNLVKLKDAYYWIDSTWDDTGSSVNYTYFLVGDRNFKSSHIKFTPSDEEDILEDPISGWYQYNLPENISNIDYKN